MGWITVLILNFKGFSVKVFLIYFSLLFATCSLFAQEKNPIVKDDFISALGNEKKFYRSSELINISNKYFKESLSLSKSNREESIRRSLIGFTLANRSLEILKDKNTKGFASLSNGINELKNKFASMGVTEEMIEKSRIEFDLYLAEFSDIDRRTFPKDSMEIIGIYPGISTKDDLEDIRIGSSMLEIGGYNIICTEEYDDGKVLQHFYCAFGKDMGTYVGKITDRNYVTNEEVFSTYLNGFSKKFGKPKINNIEVENNFGRRINVTTAIWNDRYGNNLTLISSIYKIGQGALVMKASSYIKKNEIKNQKIDSERKF